MFEQGNDELLELVFKATNLTYRDRRERTGNGESRLEGEYGNKVVMLV